jgi:deoxyxylulose-5-phosphate synthase
VFALNHAGYMPTDLLVVLNDNNMSIAAERKAFERNWAGPRRRDWTPPAWAPASSGGGIQ